jgi:G:T-mismatch repair DNA endonuclease (very short patch repair protein)
LEIIGIVTQKKYDANYFNKKKNKFAWELWEYDKKKVELIRNYGYNLEVVWEKDLKDDSKLINLIIEKYDTKFKSTPKRSRED